MGPDNAGFWKKNAKRVTLSAFNGLDRAEANCSPRSCLSKVEDQGESSQKLSPVDNQLILNMS